MNLLLCFPLVVLTLASCGPQPSGGYTSSQRPTSPKPSKAEEAQQDAEWSRMAVSSGQLPQLTIRDAKASLTRQMRDPESTKFSFVRRNTETGAVCGSYNSKNGYGGYVGDREFVYYHAEGYPSPQIFFGQNIEASIAAKTITLCPVSKSTIITDPGTVIKARHT